MQIDIVCIRDPDSANEIYVYIDGHALTGDPGEPTVNTVDIDPGRGWEAEDWNESRDHEAASVHPALADRIREWFDECRDDSPYIEGDDDGPLSLTGR